MIFHLLKLGLGSGFSFLFCILHSLRFVAVIGVTGFISSLLKMEGISEGFTTERRIMQRMGPPWLNSNQFSMDTAFKRIKM